jgi:hypothetical protein
MAEWLFQLGAEGAALTAKKWVVHVEISQIVGFNTYPFYGRTRISAVF